MATAAEGRSLVIVESPAKARTISGYLPSGFVVEASVGHIRDLAQPSELPDTEKKGRFAKFAVDVDNEFEPYYIVDSNKKKKVSELKKLLKESDILYLATDEDREGEAIAWHLREALQPKVPVRRMVFHEITREAIERALDATRDIDERLVDAQETRRILDRLYGYEVSPVLWRKVKAGLSAGRVQSVATRMVVERERERMAFTAANYWDLTGLFAPDGDQPFGAKIVSVDQKKVASGRDFNDNGELTTTDAIALDAAAANAIADGLRNADFAVARVETKPYKRRPAAPFITSTLQQEASRKLRFSAKQTMRVAQSLYENGYITYMRTDSTALSQEALSAARSQATELYGPQYVPSSPRVYSKKSKNAQEAHEAIRPSGDRFRTPDQVKKSLRSDEFALYDLIWKRTVASQMEDAKGSTASVRLRAKTTDTQRECEFAASGTVITFRGFLAAYEEGRDEEREAGDDSGTDKRLPELVEGQSVDVREVSVDDHTTNPPPRYTEASLVKALEERGIGRPSTYAATIATISDRGYVNHRGPALVPSWLAFAVTRLLEEHFGQLVDYDFTASMEEDLDRIASGAERRAEWLRRFYFGDGNDEDSALDDLSAEGLKALVDDLGEIDARGISTVPIGDGIVLRVGRYGPYLERPNPENAEKPLRANVPDDVAPDEMTVTKATELFDMAADADRELGKHPETGRPIVVKAGRFGPYVTEVLSDDEAALKGKNKIKPLTASLFKSMDVGTVTYDQAVQLMSLPRIVGIDPANNEEITAQNGRFGPYLKKGTDSRSLTTEEQIFNITLDEALAIYAEPKRGRGRTAAAPLRELGEDPVTNKPVVVKDGRFGPYVTDGETNATLRSEDSVENVTIERASDLLAERRARGPAKKRAKKTAAKKTAKKTVKKTAKKTAKKATKKGAAKKVTKKAASKKTPAAKKTAKKAAQKAVATVTPTESPTESHDE